MSWDAFLVLLRDKSVPLLNVFICIISFVATPFINLFCPPIKAFVPTPEAPPTVVEKHSIADYKIIYGAGADATEITAANVLADTLKKITGLNYAAAQGVSAGENEILVGSVSGLDVSQLGADGYSIRADGTRILISGGSRGVLYGAYHFLETYFDCRWYTADLQVIPQGPAEIAVVRTEAYRPPLEYREMDWLSRSDPTFSVANGLNGNTYRSLPAEQGGTFGYNGNFGHTIINTFIKPSDFFAAHPEWYAWREESQTREPKQLCLTNPEVLAEMIKEVRGQLANGNGQPIVSITQDDNQDYCECANCKKVDEEEGSHAGTMIRFVNAVAADVTADYPDALIDTFAYQYTRTPPKIVKPLPNVIVRLCSIECCFAHTLDDPDCYNNPPFAQDIKTWSEICDRLYIWDYTTNYGCYNCVFPNFHVLQKNLQFFIKYNAKGVYEEGNYTSAECNSEYAQLRGYLLAKLLYNPNIDYDAEMNGFLKAYYGGGWQYMREFIDLMCENTGIYAWFGLEHRKLGIHISPTDKAILTLKTNQVNYADSLWTKAIELAGSETCQQNVLRSQLSWRFWKACNRKGEFNWWLLPPAQWQAENERLYYDFKDFGITRYKEGNRPGDFIFTEPPDDWWDIPQKWH